MSNHLKTYLHSLGVVNSRTTAHNPQGNGQAGRYNGIIRKAVSLALRSHNLRIEQWEEVIRLALHLLRRLLSTATNATPHERLFGSSSRTPTDTSLPTWLTTPGMVLIRRLSQTNKRNLLVEELELLEHLAPAGGKCVAEDGNPDETQVGTGAPCEEESKEDTATRDEPHQTPPRRSTRIRRAPQRLQDYVQYQTRGECSGYTKPSCLT
ncbi:conserved hypothetical protein [Trichinella spiralis]|uniref:hypothetical protein n=1 Tax=Trichinella spiralis TaxID=6334 RepID=UPI0001EFDD0C|nr:conserved hypothetical protein [Trichinella spiralis]